VSKTGNPYYNMYNIMYLLTANCAIFGGIGKPRGAPASASAYSQDLLVITSNNS
jgi:hypothetical protein